MRFFLFAISVLTFSANGISLQQMIDEAGAQKKEIPDYREEWFPVPLKRASSAASFPLIKFQLKVGVLSIVLQNHSGIVGLSGFLRI